jgi:pimeloyl-ACP methyl ester carboxylesterase
MAITEQQHQHHHHQHHQQKRVILFNGWLRTYMYPRLWMAPLSEHLRATAYEGAAAATTTTTTTAAGVEVVGNTMPAQTNDIEKYVRHLADLVGPAGPDEDTYFIGQSVGCQVILRYLAQLPPGSKVRGRRRTSGGLGRFDRLVVGCRG